MVYGLRVNRSLCEDLNLKLNHDPLFSAQTNETTTTNLQPEIEIKFFLILMTATMATGYRHVFPPDSKGPKRQVIATRTLLPRWGPSLESESVSLELEPPWCLPGQKFTTLSWNGVYLKIAHFLCWQNVNQSTPTVKTNWINKKQRNERLTSVSSRFTPSKTRFHLHIHTSSPRGLASLPSPVLAAVVPLTRQLPPWIRLHPTSEFPSWNGNPPDIDIPRSGSDFQRVASSNNDDSFAFWCNIWKVKRTFSEGGLLEEDAFVVMKCCCLELSEAF